MCVAAGHPQPRRVYWTSFEDSRGFDVVATTTTTANDAEEQHVQIGLDNVGYHAFRLGSNAVGSKSVLHLTLNGISDQTAQRPRTTTTHSQIVFLTNISLHALL